MQRVHVQGMVIPIGTMVTAATGSRSSQGVKGCFWCRSSGQGHFKLGNSGQDVYILCVHIAHSVRSNGQGLVCGAVKRSSNKNDGQNFLTSVAAVTTAPMGVTTP